MLTNRIGSQKIEERLGRSDLGSGDFDDTRQGEVASSGNMLFACAVVGLFVAGAAMGFAATHRSVDIRQAFWESLVGPPPAPAYRSRVADACDQGWKDDRFNRDQIHCWMTQEVARLCDPRERGALVDRLYAYQTAMNRSDARSNVIALRMIANPGGTLAMGIAEARSRDPNLSEQQRAAQFDKTLEMSREIMSPMEEINKDNVNKATKADLVADVKYLTEQGYVAAADFSSSPQPKIVKEGLAAARPVGASACP